jgi:Na+/H+-dicarboxylate symporter
MDPDWPALATLGVVALTWAAIYGLNRRGVNFSIVALLALAVGVPIGLVAQEHVNGINPVGQIYIGVLLATVAPLIFVSIVSAITSLGNLTKLRSIGLRSIFWLLLSNGLGVVLALGLGLAFAPGVGVNNALGAVPTDTVQGQVQEFSQVVVSFFPTNVLESFSTNAIIPIILVAVTLSVAYLSLAEAGAVAARPFRDGAEALKLVIFKAVGYVIKLTPYAIVALTAHMVGTSANLGDNFWSLLGLLALVWGACFLHTWAVNGVLLTTFARVPVVPFFRKIFPAQVTAFTTQSSAGTLPVTTERLTRGVGVHPEVASFTAPLGSTIGMPGCAGIWPILIAVWGINAYGLSYSVGDYLVLALLATIVSIGVAGVPGAATVSAATVLATAGLPLEFVAVTIPISIIADMARTMTNVTAASVSATVVARQTGLLDDDIFAGRKAFVEEVAPVPVQVAAAPAPAPAPVPAAPAPQAFRPAPAAPVAYVQQGAAGPIFYVPVQAVGAPVALPPASTPAPAYHGGQGTALRSPHAFAAGSTVSRPDYRAPEPEGALS